MFLLEGLVQWNEARADAAVERKCVCYGGQMQQYANTLSQQFMGLNLAEDYTSPGGYTGNMAHFCVAAPAFHPCAHHTLNVYR